MDVLKTFNEINVYGPSGREDLTRAAIEKIASKYSKDIKTDAMGNLIVHIPGPGKKVMFSAHMDSIGLIATVIEDGGYIRFGKVGGVSPYNIVSQTVKFANGTLGTVGVDEKAEMSKLTLEDMYIDIGAKDKADAEKYVKTGDMAVYEAPTFTTPAGMIVGPYLDDRICCVAQLLALSLVKNSPYDLYFVFTVQEEVGLRGAKPSAFAIDPDYAIVCDVTVANNVPGSKHFGNCDAGKGAAIKVMDRTIICDLDVTNKLEALAKKNKIAYQRDIITAGGTDGGFIHVSRDGVKTGGVSVTCKYVHSPQEMVAICDVEATGKLMAAFCESEM